MLNFLGLNVQELNREEPAGLGGPNCELYILDSRGALVERRAVVSRERLILTHCLVLSVLIVRASKQKMADFKSEFFFYCKNLSFVLWCCFFFFKNFLGFTGKCF